MIRCIKKCRSKKDVRNYLTTRLGRILSGNDFIKYNGLLRQRILTGLIWMSILTELS